MINELALGTWLMGGTKDPDPNNDDQKDIEVIQLAIKEGITLIDTAQNYADGKCEEIVGEAVRGLPRDSFQILTKQKQQRLSYDNVIEDCDKSLKRLGVDFIDYFVCHAPNTDFDMKDFFKATNKLFKDGKIKAVGVSNFGVDMLKLAIEVSDIPIALNQVHVSVDDDDVFRTGTYQFCVDNNIPVQAYRVFAGSEANEKAGVVIQNTAKELKLTEHQVLLSYLNSYEGMIFTIRASSKKHWDEVREALDYDLPEEHTKQIRATHTNLEGNFLHFLQL